MRTFLLVLVLVAGALALTNPDEQRLRDAMRGQKSLALEVAALLPVKRENFGLASRFTIQYGVGATVCWGAAYTVFICPKPAKNR
jgi:hypothetical protein